MPKLQILYQVYNIYQVCNFVQFCHQNLISKAINSTSTLINFIHSAKDPPNYVNGSEITRGKCLKNVCITDDNLAAKKWIQFSLILHIPKMENSGIKLRSANMQKRCHDWGVSVFLARIHFFSSGSIFISDVWIWKQWTWLRDCPTGPENVVSQDRSSLIRGLVIECSLYSLIEYLL